MVPNSLALSSSPLVCEPAELLEDVVATDVNRSADWTDGLSMHLTRRYRGDGRLVHTLAEIRLKIKLLDLSRRRLRVVRRLRIRISCSLICDGIYIGRMVLVFVTCDIVGMTANR